MDLKAVPAPEPEQPPARQLEPYFRWGSTLAAVVFASWLVANLSGLGVPLWVLLSVLLVVTGVPALRLWARLLRQQELAAERARIAALKDGPARDAEPEPRQLHY